MLLAGLLAGCAHTPAPRLIPVTLIGADGAWGGVVTAVGANIWSARGEVVVRNPDHFIADRRSLLLNSAPSPTSYVSILVGPADCVANGRRYPLKAYVGVSVDQGRGDYQLYGCATPGPPAK